MDHYNDTKIFANDLINCYEVILDLIKINGDSGIVNKKRKETYQKAIQTITETITETDCSLDVSVFIKKLCSSLTDKPKKLMKELFTNGEVTLEDKKPYNGATIKNGKIVGAEDEIEAFKNLSVLVGIGIGLGDSGVKDLVKLGYSSIEQLRIVYEQDKFVAFRKGLRNPLCKYFEGTVRIEKMSREEATKWKDTIDRIVSSNKEDDKVIIKHKIAGSYARKKEEIGDIDYVIVVNDTYENTNNANSVLYKLMNDILDEITEITEIGIEAPISVELDSVAETPSRPIKGKRYSTSIKLWFKVGELKTKVEIYGYANAEFSFPYFARSAEVNLQKKVKMQALRKGYKLSPWSLDIKDTDVAIENVPEQVNILREKIGKDKIATLKELFQFLDYSSDNN